MLIGDADHGCDRIDHDAAWATEFGYGRTSTAEGTFVCITASQLLPERQVFEHKVCMGEEDGAERTDRQ